MDHALRKCFTIGLICMVWMVYVGMAEPLLALAQENTRKIETEKDAIQKINEIVICTYKIHIDETEMHLVSAFSLYLQTSKGKMLVFSQQMLDVPYHPALSEWSSLLNSSLRERNAQEQQIATQGATIKSSTISSKIGCTWRILGAFEGVAFAFLSGQLVNNWGQRAYGVECADSIQEPKFFLGMDKEGRHRNFESPELLVEACLGGVAMDEDGKVALVTKRNGKAEILDGKTLKSMFGRVVADSQKLKQEKMDSVVVSDLEQSRNALKAEISEKEALLKKRSLEVRLANDESELAKEKSLLAMKSMESRIEFAKTDLSNAEEILNSIQERLSVAEASTKKGTGSKSEMQQIKEEYLKQKQARDLTRAKLEQLLHEHEQASLDEKRTRIEMERSKLTEATMSDQLQRELVSKQEALKEVEKRLQAMSKRASDPSSLETPDGSMKGKSREEVYRLLNEQFMKEREATAKELQQMRERIDRLEQSEKEKIKNKEAILNQRAESILATKE